MDPSQLNRPDLDWLMKDAPPSAEDATPPPTEPAPSASPTPPAVDERYRRGLLDTENDESMSWLFDGQPPTTAQPDTTGRPRFVDDGSDDTPSPAPAAAGSGRPLLYDPKRQLEVADAVARDVGTAITEVGNWIVGGPMRGVQSGIRFFVDPLVRAIDANTPLGAISEAVGLEDFGEPGEDGQPKHFTLPNPVGWMDDAESVTGSILQGTTQFATGFGAAGATVKGAGIVANLVKAAIADFAAFEGQSGNFANFVQQYPALQTALGDYLATDENTPELEGRLKNVAANFLPSALGEPFVRTTRGIREKQRAAELSGELPGPMPAAVPSIAEAPSAGHIEQLLGNPTDDLVKVVDTAVAQVDTGVPDHVAAKSLADAQGSHKADAPPAGTKRLYTVERDGQPIAPETDDLSAAQAAIKAEGGTQGTTHQIVYRDVGPDGQPVPAPRETGSPPFSREIFINFARIDSADDVKLVIGQMADAMAPAIKAKQRGVRTNAQTLEAAGDENAWKLLIGERKGNLPNAEETLALRQLWASSGERLLEVARAAASNDTEAVFAFRRMMAVHNLVQREVAGIRTEQARSLQQWRIPAGAGKEKLDQLDRIIQMNGGAGVNKAMVNAVLDLAAMPDGARRVDYFTRKTPLMRSMAMVREFQINSMLSGWKTHVVNFMGNTLAIGQAIAERFVAGRLGSVFNPIEGVKRGEAIAMAIGMKAALRDAFRLAAHSFKTGESSFGRDRMEGPRVRALSAEAAGWDGGTLHGRGLDMLGSVVNIPGRLMSSSDEFFKTINYRGEIRAVAFRMASEEVERGLISRDDLGRRMMEIAEDPPENVRIAAQDFAVYNTFTSDPGKLTRAIMDLRSSVDEIFRYPLGTHILPFVNTPANLFKYMFERTPLGPLMARNWEDMAAGGVRRNQAMARMGLGVGTSMLALDLAMDGLFTGRGPKDAEERKALARLGWQKYSVRIPTEFDSSGTPTAHRYFAYNRLDPIGGQIAMAAELADIIRNGGDGNYEDIQETFVGMAMSASQVYMDKSMLSGFSDFVEALHDPERYGNAWFERLTGTFVPNVLNQVRQQTDPVQRHVTNAIDGLRNRVPGLSSSLPPRLDYWGQPMTYRSGLGPVYDATSPVFSRSTEDAEPIDNEFFKLDTFPDHPKQLRVDGGSVNLRNLPEVHNRFVTLTAATKASALVKENHQALWDAKKRGVIYDLDALGDLTLKEALNKIVTGQSDALTQHFYTPTRDQPYIDSYFEADPDAKKKIIEDVTSVYRKAATLQVIREFSVVVERRAAQPTREERAQRAPMQ